MVRRPTPEALEGASEALARREEVKRSRKERAEEGVLSD
jgi:hypothetical protein